jgi:segregation and condensation protein A
MRYVKIWLMETEFKIKMGEFEGPLELLLDLVEKRKLHINSVSLSQVADEFIEHTRSYESFPIGDSADFILIASTLLLIKSRSLLPNLELSEEEKGSIEDLEARLALYKKYKELAIGINKMFGNFLYFANDSKVQPVIFAPTPEITLASIEKALGDVLKSIPKEESLPKVTVAKIISLEEMMDNLSKRMENSLKMSFRDFSRMGKTEKVNVIVSFLAMLELVKQGLVRVSQQNHFEDIDMEANEVNTPSYK